MELAEDARLEAAVARLEAEALKARTMERAMALMSALEASPFWEKHAAFSPLGMTVFVEAAAALSAGEADPRHADMRLVQALFQSAPDRRCWALVQQPRDVPSDGTVRQHGQQAELLGSR